MPSTISPKPLVSDFYSLSMAKFVPKMLGRVDSCKLRKAFLYERKTTHVYAKAKG